MSYFEQLGLAEPLLRALSAKGYADPTPIQQQAIPALMKGRDLLGIAQTGTGKTAAFSLPSLHRLMNNPVPRKPASCRMLVLSPTRELAAQIADNMRGYAKFLDMNVQVVFGGVPVGKQSRALVPGCDVLVATPGRLLDLIEQRALTLRNVEIFVLDEADQMMDLGFIKPLTRLAAMLPKERQSLFFSATMPKAIADLGKRFINDPVRVEVSPQATTAERVEQYATFVEQKEKQALLTIRLRQEIASGALDKALVFSRTKHGADRVARHLAAANISAAAIHGNKSQGQRTAALQGFRSGNIQVLVATDIAARGIDVSGVSHVFNFELPNLAEQYVHRIGRTARAGANGIAISFVAPDEKAYLRDIEKLTRIKLDMVALPEDFIVEARRLPLPSKAAVSEAVGDSRGRGGRGAPGGDRRDRAPGGERRERAQGGPRSTAQNRDGQSRDGSMRRENQRTDAPRQDRHGYRTPSTGGGNGPSFDPLSIYTDRRPPVVAANGEPVPKRLRPDAEQRPLTARGDGAPRGDGARHDGERAARPPRRFGAGGGAGAPQNPGARRGRAGRAG